jgi:HK97 family phage portal protein
MSFKQWSAAVDGAAKEASLPGVPVVSLSNMPPDLLDRGWDSLNGLLGLDSRSTYLYGKNSTGIAIAVMCADVIARDISKAEMLLYKRRTTGRGYDLVQANEHPIARMFMLRPSQWHLWVELWRMTVLHLKLTENAYLYKDGFRADGSFDGLIPIQPANCRAMVSPGGKLFYEVFAGTEYEKAQLGQNYFLVPAERIIHMRGRTMDGLYGLSSVMLGDPIFDIVSAIGAYQRNVFDNDGQQALAFETEGAFGSEADSDAAFRRLKGQLTERWKKSRTTGDPILLEAGLKAKIISATSKESEAKDSFNQQVMRICGLMNCPPHKIFALENVAYNNASAMNRAYYNDALDPVATLIQENLRAGLFTEEEMLTFSPQFDQIKLMANDIESLTKLVDICMKDALLTFDEGREVLPFRFGPIKNGDRRMMPVNMAMIGADGEIIANAAAGQTPNLPAPTPEEDPDKDPDATDDQEGKNAPLRLVQ